MSWMPEKSSLTYFQKFCINILKCGQIPKHIAIIMDGNRRYAEKSNLEKIDGHIKGFDKLSETLQWCLELDIKEVTVYAFSIENFKRSKEEVDKLMNLAIEKFEKLLEEKERIMKENVCIRVIGNLNLLNNKLKKLIAEAILMTRNNNKTFLNIAFAYTSHDEITNTLQTIREGVQSNSIAINDINEQLITNCLYTNQSPNPDIIVRTSGEVRFSDYLLWQITENSNICFTNVLWPEFCIWHLLIAIFKYQRCYNELNNFKKLHMNSNQWQQNERVESFLNNLQQKRFNILENYLVL